MDKNNESNEYNTTTCFICFRIIPRSQFKSHWEECTKKQNLDNDKSKIKKVVFDMIDFVDELEDISKNNDKKTCPNCLKSFFPILIDNHLKYCEIFNCIHCSNKFSTKQEHDNHITKCQQKKSVASSISNIKKECPYCLINVSEVDFEIHLITCFETMELKKSSSEDQNFTSLIEKNNNSANIPHNNLKDDFYYNPEDFESNLNHGAFDINIQSNPHSQIIININYNNHNDSYHDNSNIDNQDEENYSDTDGDIDSYNNVNTDSNYEELMHLDDNVTNPLKEMYIKLLPEKKVDKKFLD